MLGRRKLNEDGVTSVLDMISCSQAKEADDVSTGIV